MDFDLEGSNSMPSQSFLEICVSEKGTKRLSILVLKGQATAAVWVIFGMGLNSRPIKPAEV